MAYAANLVGADTNRRTTFAEYELTSVERANDNKLLMYCKATQAVAVGTCTVDVANGNLTDAAGNWTADVAFVTGEYGWVWKADEA